MDGWAIPALWTAKLLILWFHKVKHGVIILLLWVDFWDLLMNGVPSDYIGSWNHSWASWLNLSVISIFAHWSFRSVYIPTWSNGDCESLQSFTWLLDQIYLGRYLSFRGIKGLVYLVSRVLWYLNQLCCPLSDWTSGMLHRRRFWNFRLRRSLRIIMPSKDSQKRPLL